MQFKIDNVINLLQLNYKLGVEYLPMPRLLIQIAKFKQESNNNYNIIKTKFLYFSQ